MKRIVVVLVVVLWLGSGVGELENDLSAGLYTRLEAGCTKLTNYRTFSRSQSGDNLEYSFLF